MNGKKAYPASPVPVNDSEHEHWSDIFHVTPASNLMRGIKEAEAKLVRRLLWDIEADTLHEQSKSVANLRGFYSRLKGATEINPIK